MSGLDRARGLVRPRRHGDRRDPRRARFKCKHLKCTRCFRLDRETTTRRNDETTKLARHGSFVDRTIVPERFRSVHDPFFVPNGSFVVSSFRSLGASNTRVTTSIGSNHLEGQCLANSLQPLACPRGGTYGWIWYGGPRSGGIDTMVRKNVFRSYISRRNT